MAFQKNGNLRFSQDANQQVSGKVTFTTYDGLSRALITGEADAGFTTLDGHATYAFESDSSNWIGVRLYDVTVPPNSFPWDFLDYGNASSGKLFTGFVC